MDEIKNPPAFVGVADGAALIGISPSGFRNYVAIGLLPKPKKLGTRSLWDVSELINTLRSQLNNTAGGK